MQTRDHTFGCAQHQGNRPYQEDYFSLPPENDIDFAAHGGQLYILSDGMGGHENGDKASVLGTRTLRAAYRRKTLNQSIPDALLQSVYEANKAVLDSSNQESGRGMGTTIVAAVLFDGQLFWASVGDSYLCVYRHNTLKLLNTLHVYEEELKDKVRQGLISHDAMKSDPQKDALTAFIGMAELSEIDCPNRGFSLQPGDRILLASDGLFKFLPEDGIIETLRTFYDSQQCSEILVERTLVCNIESQDNITVLVLDLRGNKNTVQEIPPTQVKTDLLDAPSIKPSKYGLFLLLLPMMFFLGAISMWLFMQLWERVAPVEPGPSTVTGVVPPIDAIVADPIPAEVVPLEAEGATESGEVTMDTTEAPEVGQSGGESEAKEQPAEKASPAESGESETPWLQGNQVDTAESKD